MATTTFLGQRVDLGIRRQLVVAPLVTAAAVFWPSRISANSSYFGSLFVPLLLVGASIGVTFVPLTMAATIGVPPEEAGLASGQLNTTRQLGGALGLALLATIPTATTNSELALGATHLAARSHGYTRALEVIAALSVLGAIGARFLGADTRIEPGSTAEDGNPDAATTHVAATDEIATMTDPHAASP